MTESTLTATPHGARLWRMVVVADTHLNEHESECSSPFAVNQLANARTRYVIDAINAEAPSLVLHLGDLIHPVPALPSYDEAASEFHALTAKLDAPLRLVPGNHDVGDKPYPFAPAGTVRDSYIAKWHEQFGADYYAFTHNDCRFIVVNAQTLNSGLEAEARQRDWLETELSRHADARTFVALHYPPFLYGADEREHYDNLAEPGRSWLVALIERYQPEAVFCGHVHNFWLNEIGRSHCYILPSTAFVRQDYSEIYRVLPGPEGGRNDQDKLGFLVIDVHERGHVCHMVRTFGEELPPDGDAPDLPRGPGHTHPATRQHHGIGIDLRQPWCDVQEIAPSGALDEFERKSARNDYPLLALMELGIQSLRVPLHDLLDERVAARMRLMAALGQRFTVYCFGLPAAGALDAVRHDAACIESLEVVVEEASLDALVRGLATFAREVPGVPIRLSRLITRAHHADTGEPYYHTINHGFLLDEADAIAARLAEFDSDRVIGELVWRIPADAPALDVVRGAVQAAGITGRRSALQLRTVGPNPANTQDDPWVPARRAVEFSLLLAANPEVSGFLDSFADVERGYFMRAGLVDRRYNPRAGWYALKTLHAALDARDASLNEIGSTSTGLFARGPKAVFALHDPTLSDSALLPDPGDGATQRVDIFSLASGDGVASTWQTPEPGRVSVTPDANESLLLVIAQV